MSLPERHLPARLVLAPEDTGEELLLVSPAREVRLEWKVGRFSLLLEEGTTLGERDVYLNSHHLLPKQVVVERIPALQQPDCSPHCILKVNKE